MKVAIVINTSWNIYNFRQNLVKKLVEVGHEVIAIAPHDAHSDKLEEMGCTYTPLAMDSRGINPIKDIALTFELFQIYRRVKPDVILHYTIKPNINDDLSTRNSTECMKSLSSYADKGSFNCSIMYSCVCGKSAQFFFMVSDDITSRLYVASRNSISPVAMVSHSFRNDLILRSILS